MTQAAQEDSIPLNTLDDFVKCLYVWHKRKVDLLKHMTEIPDGFEVKVGEGPDLVLTGDVLAGYKAGLALALIELGTLPFAVEFDESPATTG